MPLFSPMQIVGFPMGWLNRRKNLIPLGHSLPEVTINNNMPEYISD